MHFAAWLKVGESVRKPLEYYQNNVAGTLAVLEAMRDAGVKRFIFSSTCAVYGEPTSVPIVETLDKQPINAYGETKLTIEQALPHLERALRPQVDRAALFQRRRRASRRLDRRGSRRRDSPHSAGDSRRQRRHAAEGVRRGLSDAGRHLPARLHPRLRSGRRAHPRARGARARRAVGRLQRRHRHAALGEGGDRHGQPGRRAAGGLGTCAAPAGRSCGTLCSQRPRAARTGLAAALRRSRGHRPACVAVAFHPSAGVW